MVKRLVHILLSPVGRITRAQFWWSWILVLLLGIGVSRANQNSRDWVLLITYAYLTFTIYGKRLHDLGRSALALVFPFAIHIGCFIGTPFVVNSLISNRASYDALTTALMLLGAAPAVVWLVYAFIVGLPVGEDRDNRFGLNPRSENSRAMTPGESSPEG